MVILPLQQKPHNLNRLPLEKEIQNVARLLEIRKTRLVLLDLTTLVETEVYRDLTYPLNEVFKSKFKKKQDTHTQLRKAINIFYEDFIDLCKTHSINTELLCDLADIKDLVNSI